MLRSPRPRPNAVLVLVAVAGVSVASSGYAAVCEGGDLPVSCHFLLPSAAQAKGGGTPLAIAGYPPLGALAGSLQRPASSVNANASDPSLDLESSAAAWGSAGREPIAAASIRYALEPADGRLFLNSSTSSYKFTCDPAADALCHPDGSIVSSPRASLRRHYRVVKAPGAQLPADVTSAPVLVDYEVSFAHTGSRLGKDGTTAAATSAQASVAFGMYSPSGSAFLFNGKEVTCNSGDPGTLACNGASGSVPTKGTLPVMQVQIGEATRYYLKASALVRGNFFPYCKPRPEIAGSPCLVDPWSGTARVITDPYVYVDPAWPHAALVRVEVAEDEAETSWVVPQRTPIDHDTMKLLDAPPDAGTDGGGGGGGAPDAGTPGATPSNPPGTGGGTDTGAGGSGGDDGGCAFVGGRGVASGASWFVVGLAALVLRVRRARRSLRAARD